MARLDPKIRKNDLLEHALVLARKVGYTNVTRATIAKAAGVSEGLVSAHWGTMPQLKRSIIRQAINTLDLRIIGQGIAACDPQCSTQKLDSDLRQKAIRTLL